MAVDVLEVSTARGRQVGSLAEWLGPRRHLTPVELGTVPDGEYRLSIELVLGYEPDAPPFAQSTVGTTTVEVELGPILPP